jgi:uncharacterized protein YceK
MRNLMFFVLGTIALCSSGCTTYFTAVRSVQGKAYVHSGSAFWNCDATSGEPTCYKVVEIPVAGSAK